MILRFLKYIFIFLFIFLWYRALFNNEKRVLYNDLKYFIEDRLNYNLEGFCKISKSNLTIRPVDLDVIVDFVKVKSDNEDVLSGGYWKPDDCKSHQKVAVILPYRNRTHQLHTLVKRLHSMLKKQQIEYTIFVVNQMDGENFNRGMILNIGVIEAMKLATFDCIVFNDVDLVPENDANLYMCDDGVRQISSAIDDTRYHVMFWNNAGGVISINVKNYFKINGHPNVYWGWGNEDDDFSIRTYLSDLILSRPLEHIGRFKMVKHLRGFRNNEAYWLFRSFEGRWKYDGLNSLISVDPKINIENSLIENRSVFLQNNIYVPYKSPYQLISTKKHNLYTNISVKLIKMVQNLRETPHTWKSLYWLLHFYGWI